MKISEFFVPLIIVTILIWGLIKKVNIVDEFVVGAKENLKTAFDILPSLILIMTAVGMFTSSGATEYIAKAVSPLTSFLGFPDECISLAIIRPISGSGALATLETILTNVSPDSYSGRVASVLMGSTETTFYTITVYFASLKRKPDARIFFLSSFSELIGFVLSALAVRLYFS